MVLFPSPPALGHPPPPKQLHLIWFSQSSPAKPLSGLAYLSSLTQSANWICLALPGLQVCPRIIQEICTEAQCPP